MMPTTATSAPQSEITGIRSAIATLTAIAAAHRTAAANEGFLGSLREMDAGAEDQGNYSAAVEAAGIAAAAWSAAAESVRRNNDPVGQAYAVSPGAANKQANTNE